MGNILQREEAQALVEWAARHPRDWKIKLDSAWLRAGEGVVGYNPTLHQIRNRFGPSWLTRISINRIKAIAGPPPPDPLVLLTQLYHLMCEVLAYLEDEDFSVPGGTPHAELFKRIDKVMAQCHPLIPRRKRGD